MMERTTHVLVNVLELPFIELLNLGVTLQDIQEIFLSHLQSKHLLLQCKRPLDSRSVVFQSLVENVDDVPEEFDGTRARISKQVEIALVL